MHDKPKGEGIQQWDWQNHHRQRALEPTRDGQMYLFINGKHIRRDLNTGRLYVSDNMLEGWREVPGGVYPDELRIRMKEGTVL